MNTKEASVERFSVSEGRGGRRISEHRGERTLSGPNGGRRARLRGGKVCIFLLVLFLFGAGCRSPLEEGTPAPQFDLKGLDGKTVSLTELKGRVVALHFWATWCPPCVEELPRIIKLFQGSDPEKFVLLPVCVDHSGPEYIREFLDLWGLETNSYLDPGGRLAKRYGTIRFPETYILDKNGILRKKVIGADDWRASQWERFLQKVFEEGRNGP